MKNKTVMFMSISLALLILAASCNAGAPNDAPGGDIRDTAANRGSMDAPSLHASPEYGGFSINESGIRLTDQTDSTAGRRIIWNASVDIEAQDASALHNLLIVYAAELGGYEHENDIQHHELHSVVRATFKVPPQNLQAFLTYAGEKGRVVNRKLHSEDITENYHDAQLRLESTRNTLAQYYRFMEETKTLDEVLRLQRIIDGIIENIEAFEGRLRMWDFLSDMATVSVFIRQENDPVKIEEERREIRWNSLSADDMGYLIRSGFVAVTSTAVTILQWIAVSLLVSSPLWIVALAVLWVILRRRKKRQAAMMQTHQDEE